MRCLQELLLPLWTATAVPLGFAGFKRGFGRTAGVTVPVGGFTAGTRDGCACPLPPMVDVLPEGIAAGGIGMRGGWPGVMLPTISDPVLPDPRGNTMGRGLAGWPGEGRMFGPRKTSMRIGKRLMRTGPFAGWAGGGTTFGV